MYFKIKFWGGFFSWNQSDISPDPKGQVAVEFPFCQHLMLAPGETVGIPCSLCDTIVRPRPTMTIVTCVVIHKAVTYGLLVTKFHLQTIVKIIFGTTQTQFVELERQKKYGTPFDISFCNQTLNWCSSCCDQNYFNYVLHDSKGTVKQRFMAEQNITTPIVSKCFSCNWPANNRTDYRPKFRSQ